MDGSGQPRTQFPFLPAFVVEQLRTETARRANRAEGDDFATRFPEHRGALHGDLAAAANPSSFGPYEVLEVLGRGGMGIVYRARERSTSREYALKVLARDWRLEPEAVERFRREGRLTGALTHPRCVLVHTADFEQDLPFIAMELVRGSDLQALIDTCETIAVERAIALTLDVADGLVHAHRLGIVHRDIKPSNCFVDHEGRGKIGDFGLSRLVNEAPGALTSQGFVGTYVYAAPEQVERSFTDARSDVYSTGALLYALLTGSPPFIAPTRELLVARILRDPLTPASKLRHSVPSGLDDILRRALARDPSKRFQTMQELRDALALFHVPRRLRPSTAIRVLSHYPDALLVWCAMALATWRPVLSFEPMTIAAAVFVYYTLAIALFGRTLGMTLLKIGLSDARVFQRPTWFATGVFAAVPAAVNAVLYDWLAGSPHVAPFVLLVAALSAVPGRMRFMEWITGARLVSFATAAIPAAASEARPASVDGERRVGPFLVGADVDLSAVTATLAFEPHIDRIVWLRLNRNGAAGVVSEKRRAVARSTRLRWIAGGTHGDCQWDAFTAPNAVPLSDLLRGEVPWARAPMDWLSWSRLRTLLVDLVEELEIAVREGCVPTELDSSHVLVSQDGHAILDDLREASMGFGPQPDDEKRAVTFVETLVAKLVGRRMRDCPPSGPMPLHATEVCVRLVGGENAGKARRGATKAPAPLSLVGMRAQLQETERFPTRLDLPHRLAISALVVLGVAGWPGATLFVQHVRHGVGEQRAVEVLDSSANLVSQDLAAHPQWRDSDGREAFERAHKKAKAKLGGRNGSMPSPSDVDPRPARLDELRRTAGELRQSIAASAANLAFVLPSRWTRSPVSQRDRDWDVRSLAWSAAPVRSLLRGVSQIEGTRLNVPFGLGAADRSSASGSRDAPPSGSIIFFTLVLLSPWWFGFLGLVVVDPAGRIARRRVRLGRWLLAWGPPVIVGWSIMSSSPRAWWLCAMVGVAWMLLLFSRWRAARPRAWHDEVVDVWVVPR